MVKKINLFDNFDAIFCINMKHRLDRWDRVMREFTKLGISDRIIRLEGVRTPENGHVGCMLSHIRIMQMIQAMKWKNALVFEDDIEFIGPVESIDLVLPKNWEMLYLGGYFNSSDMPYLENFGELFSAVGVRTLHAVAYSSNFSDRFLKKLKEPVTEVSISSFIDKHTAIDVYISRFLQDIGKTFILPRIFFKQKNNFSDTAKKVINYDGGYANFSVLQNESKIIIFIKKFSRPIFRIWWKLVSRLYFYYKKIKFFLLY